MHDQSQTDRYRVVGLLVLLFAITYLDRGCISVAGPRMPEDLHISPIGWAALLFVGALLWLKIDAWQALGAEPRAEAAQVSV